MSEHVQFLIQFPTQMLGQTEVREQVECQGHLKQQCQLKALSKPQHQEPKNLVSQKLHVYTELCPSTLCHPAIHQVYTTVKLLSLKQPATLSQPVCGCFLFKFNNI